MSMLSCALLLCPYSITGGGFKPQLKKTVEHSTCNHRQFILTQIYYSLAPLLLDFIPSVKASLLTAVDKAGYTAPFST